MTRLKLRYKYTHSLGVRSLMSTSVTTAPNAGVSGSISMLLCEEP
jgi:hypothetical protein